MRADLLTKGVGMNIVAFQEWAARRASLEDAVKELALAFCAAFARADLDQVIEMIHEELELKHTYFVAVEDDRIVGLVSWRRYGERRHRMAELYHIGVVPNAEVRRHGVGRQLVAAIEHDADTWFRTHGQSGVRRVVIMTHKEKIDAQAFYLRLGYGRTGLIYDFFHEGSDELVYAKLFPASTA